MKNFTATGENVRENDGRCGAMEFKRYIVLYWYADRKPHRHSGDRSKHMWCQCQQFGYVRWRICTDEENPESSPPMYSFRRMVITVWDNAEFGCELAYTAAKLTGSEVLLADLDLLAPKADLILNVSKYTPNWPGMIRPDIQDWISSWTLPPGRYLHQPC